MDSEPNCLKIVLLKVSFKDVYSAHPKLIFKYIYCLFLPGTDPFYRQSNNQSVNLTIFITSLRSFASFHNSAA